MPDSTGQQTARVRGSSAIELVIGIMVLIPIVLVVFDLGVIVMSVQANEAVCRDAARVAASGSPLDVKARAQAVISRANTTTGFKLSDYTLDSVTSSLSQQDLSNLSAFGGTAKGSVTVQTSVDVHPFLVNWLYAGGKPLHFQTQRSFPFTSALPTNARSIA